MTINRKYSLNENYFDTIDTKNKAYWLGFLYADGCITTGGNRYFNIALSINKKDDSHVARFRKNLGSESPIRISRRDNTSTIQLYSQKMFEDLRKLGCVERKSLILSFPKAEQVPQHLLSHFVRGYFDGDGSAYKHLGTTILKFTSGSFKFLIGLQDLFYNELELERPVQHGGNGHCFELKYIRQSHVYKVYKYLYKDANIYLERKKNIAKDILDARFILSK